MPGPRRLPPLLLALLALAVLLFSLLPVQTAAQVGCAAKKCYPNNGQGCTFAPTPVDFVFFIDVSGSMRWKIDSVITGLIAFSNNLVAKNIDATYSVWDVATSSLTAFQSGETRYGPRQRLAPTRDILQFQSLLQNGLNTRVYNFRESMFEAVRIALGVAANSNGNPRVSWREGASRVFVLLTDEDADPAEFSENLLGLDADLRSVCYADLVAQSRWPQYLNEISVVTQAIIREKVSTYMLTNPPFNPPLNNDSFIPGADRCLVEYQYGSPSLQIQNDDLTGFDSRKTLEGLNKDAKASSSLQARLLGNNVYSRVFDINMVASPAFVNNFFSLIVEDVGTCSNCFVYTCASNSTCLAPVNICGCDGIPNSGTVTDCKGICGGSNKVFKDCAGRDSCRLPTQQIYTDCRGVCSDPTVQSTTYETDTCGECVITGTKGSKYTSSCAAKPYTAASLCTSYTCGDYCLASPQTSICLSDCNSYGYPAPASALVNGTSVTVASKYVRNDCGRCVERAKLQEENAKDKDLCGVCKNSAGYNATKCVQNCQLNWVYDPPYATLYDRCGQRCATNCTQDCNNEPFVSGTIPKNIVNSCGVCILTAQNATNTTKDLCGVCTNRPDYVAALCTLDCEGVWRYPLNATTLNDQCGVRCGKQCVKDCGGEFYVNGTTPKNSPNRCGVCVKTPVASTDKTNQDLCGVCNNTANYNASYCQQDCAGVWTYFPSGDITRLLDSCGKRCGTNKRDLCGVCDGNVTRLNLDWQYQQCACNGGQPIATETKCGRRYCAGDLKLLEPCNDTVTCTVLSACNECLDGPNGSVKNATILIDDCGQCYPASMPEKRNQNRTKCGICFGKEEDCNRCKDSLLCDANPIVKTSSCGNFIVEAGEECDAGPSGNATCSSSCLKITGADNTPVIAGAIGGALGGALLIAGAAVAFWYAKKNGLLGLATKEVNLGASTNPLYQSPVHASSNPIYVEGTETANPAFSG